jgi:hypothetical protein
MSENAIDPQILEVLEKYPFLTFGTHGINIKKDYLGVVQNSDSKLVSMYIIDDIQEPVMLELFLEFCETWWWNSNRRVPINMFIKDPRFKLFRSCLKHFSRKDFEHKVGPMISLADALTRRVRKRQVTLVRRIP